jgi:hypothetical protein
MNLCGEDKVKDFAQTHMWQELWENFKHFCSPIVLGMPNENGRNSLVDIPFLHPVCSKYLPLKFYEFIIILVVYQFTYKTIVVQSSRIV